MMPIQERFESKFIPEPNTGCWLWTMCPDKDGYGVFGVNCKTVKAHRMSWTLYRGSLPDNILVCHKCDTPACVNPEHLFLGTNRDNVLDMIKKGRDRSVVAKLRNVTHCRCGKPLTVMPSGGRRCRPCTNIKLKQYRENKRRIKNEKVEVTANGY